MPRDKADQADYKRPKSALEDPSLMYALIALLGFAVIIALVNLIEFGRPD